jgi:hypothetical protein
MAVTSNQNELFSSEFIDKNQLLFQNMICFPQLIYNREKLDLHCQNWKVMC